MAWLKNNIENLFAKWLLPTIGGLIIGGTVFYFNVNNTLAQQSSDINKLKQVVESSDNALNTWKINNLEVKTAEQTTDIKELKKEFKDFQNQYNKDREEILKLLYQINRK